MGGRWALLVVIARITCGDLATVVALAARAALFWSVTIYDPLTRSEIKTDQMRAALRSQFEIAAAHAADKPSVELRFDPKPLEGGDALWIQTLPDRGWFAYFRIYGPKAPAFDGSWKLGDFELV